MSPKLFLVIFLGERRITLSKLLDLFQVHVSAKHQENKMRFPNMDTLIESYTRLCHEGAINTLSNNFEAL